MNPPSPSPAAQSRPLNRLDAGFGPASVRCAAEARLWDAIQKAPSFHKRLLDQAEGSQASLVQSNLRLLTGAYRVDAAITPKIDQLRDVLRSVLRLVQPVDVYVTPNPELGAYCIQSRKGTRLVMCLNAGLFHTLTPNELLFVMGHEAGHALLGHTRIPRISFDDPDFSPFEVVRMRALERRQEISCDRVGLLVCQDVRVASSALFKVMCGLPDKWQSFDETAFAKHFDEIGGMAEIAGLDDPSSTHPIIPMRVKALIAFAQSKLYADAFGREQAELATEDMERSADYLLSVLEPDLSALETTSEQDALNRFLVSGALVMIAADGIIEPAEVDFLKARMEFTKEMSDGLLQPDFIERSLRALEPDAATLAKKLSITDRAGILHQLGLVAFSAGGFADGEQKVLAEVAMMLRVPPELYQRLVHDVASSAPPVPQPKPARKGRKQVDETTIPPTA